MCNAQSDLHEQFRPQRSPNRFGPSRLTCLQNPPSSKGLQVGSSVVEIAFLQGFPRHRLSIARSGYCPPLAPANKFAETSPLCPVCDIGAVIGKSRRYLCCILSAVFPGSFPCATLVGSGFDPAHSIRFCPARSQRQSSPAKLSQRSPDAAYPPPIVRRDAAGSDQQSEDLPLATLPYSTNRSH